MYQHLRTVVIILVIAFSAESMGQVSKIEKIEYAFDGFAGLPKYELIIYSDKTAIFHAISGNYGKPEYESELVGYGTMHSKNGDSINIRDTEVKGIFKTQLKRKKWNTLMELTKSIEIEFNEKIYPSLTLHNSSSNLTVSFENGETKSIRDNSSSGTKQLGELYHFLNALRFNQQWE